MAHTKKKVLIFVPEFPVLSETFIEREIAALARLSSLDIVVVSLRQSHGFVSEHLIPRVHYISLSVFDILAGTKYLLRFPAFLRLLLISLENKNRGMVSSLYLLIKSLGFANKVSGYNADHIHAHFLSESSTLMFFAAYLLKKPYSISAHARDVFGSNAKAEMNAELVAEKASYASFITVCNAKAYNECLEKAGGRNRSKVHLNYHGVDEQYISSIKPLARNYPKPLIFSIGRLVEKKGFDYLIKAANILKSQGLDFELKIAGPGPLYDKLTQHIRELSLNDKVEILGGGKGIQNFDALSYLKSSTVFVLPSIQTADKDAEGIPNTLVEAAFCRVPIVATTTGSIEEFVENNVSGVVVQPANPEALAKAIQFVLSDTTGLTEQMTAKAYDKVVAAFGMEKAVKELERLLLL